VSRLAARGIAASRGKGQREVVGVLRPHEQGEDVEGSSSLDADGQPTPAEHGLPRGSDARGSDWQLALAFLGTMLVLYSAIAFALYRLIAFII
jgi:hypothetical protein